MIRTAVDVPYRAPTSRAHQEMFKALPHVHAGMRLPSAGHDYDVWWLLDRQGTTWRLSTREDPAGVLLLPAASGRGQDTLYCLRWDSPAALALGEMIILKRGPRPPA